MWPRKSQIDWEWTGRGPLRRRRSALDCTATEEEEEEESLFVHYLIAIIFVFTWP
jgi:hypothetical protein